MVLSLIWDLERREDSRILIIAQNNKLLQRSFSKTDVTKRLELLKKLNSMRKN